MKQDQNMSHKYCQESWLWAKSVVVVQQQWKELIITEWCHDRLAGEYEGIENSPVITE